MTDFDADKFKLSTQAQWDNVAAHWNAWGPLLDRWLSAMASAPNAFLVEDPSETISTSASRKSKDDTLSLHF